MASGVLWRINEHECDYTLLNPAGAIFSTKGLNLAKHGVAPGTMLYVVASGHSRKKGLLGIWEVTAQPFIAAQGVGAVQSYTAPFKQSRMQKQWRVHARLVRDVYTEIGDNLEYVFAYTTAMRFVKNVCPTILLAGDVDNLRYNYAA